MRRSLAFALLVTGCWGPKDTALFERDNSGMGAQSNVGGALAGAGQSAGGLAGIHSAFGGTSGGGIVRAGSAGVGMGSAPPTAGGGGTAGTGGGTPMPEVIESCDMVRGSTVSELNGHCYRISEQELTFDAARDSCKQAGGHLVTISSEAENEFARDLHDGEHWIGASDGRLDGMPGVGPYSWVSGEPWEYSNWEAEQPNAFETDCPEESIEDECFEHCGFQTDEGDWNDRSCWHAIVAICEWDVEPGAGGAAGAHAGGAPP